MTNKEERRQRQRVMLECDVQLSHPQFGEFLVKAKDMSDQGLFLQLDSKPFPSVGTVLAGKVLGLSGEPAPTINMEVVRHEKNGIGLRLIEGNAQPYVH